MSYQVAAAANRPVVKKETTTGQGQPAKSKELSKSLFSTIPADVHPASTLSHEDPANGMNATTAAPSSPQDGADETTARALATMAVDEKSTHTSSSRGPQLKKDDSDTKSVASRTTLTLDEKESLRPDDSASMHAPVEEDTATSPPESVATHSKPPSDPETRAFHDQLRQLRLSGDQRVVMPRAQRPAGMSEQRGGVIAFQAPAAINDLTPPSEAEIIRPCVTDPKKWIMPPDDKLLEALASPKDRLFVLKVEQDLIDFIKDPKYVHGADPSRSVHC